MSSSSACLRLNKALRLFEWGDRVEIMTDQGFRKTIKYLRAFIIISLIGMICTLIILFGILGYAKVLGAPPLAVPNQLCFSLITGH
jgi:hypothetical protein